MQFTRAHVRIAEFTRSLTRPTLLLLLTLALPAAFPSRAFSLDCYSNSTSSSVITSWPCADYFDVVTTRYANSTTPITVAYMVHKPATTPTALVVLLAGGNGQTGVQGSLQTHLPTANGNNFLVRSAALFAAGGFLAVTVDAPSSATNFSLTQYDEYRVSPRHAQDIVAIIDAVQGHYGTNLDVFLAGTSRGALSAVAQFQLGIGSFLSSAVTTNGPNDDPAMLYLGKLGVPHLAAGFMHNIPAEVLYNSSDQCTESPPAGSIALSQQLGVNIPVALDEAAGGMQTSTACEALSYHGFYTIETTAVSAVTSAMTDVVNATNQAFPNRQRPVLSNPPALPQAMFQTKPGTAVCLDLATLVQSPSDTKNLEFILPYRQSSRGGHISRSGSVVTYTPPSGTGTPLHDGFVYVVADGQHGKAAGIVTVNVTANGTGGNCSP